MAPGQIVALFHLFIWVFYSSFNTVQVLAWREFFWAEETSTYSWK